MKPWADSRILHAAVLTGKFILAVALGVSMIVTSAPATPDFYPAAQALSEGCCNRATHPPPGQHESKLPCHTESCVMQCCRLVPVQQETRPILSQTFLVVRAEPLPLVALHTLTDPDAIFHPPRG